MAARIDSATNLAITERLVARIWDRQGPFALPLHTTEGEEIQVVYRGRHRWDRGPDFAGALIAGARADMRHGEVEIHVCSSDWWAHGHHRDPHYNQVILQVVLWNDVDRLIQRQDGVTIPTLALAPHLTIPLDALSDYSLSEIPRPSPCWRKNQSGDEALGDLLDSCGMERFAAKAARFESDLTCCSPDQLLYQGIADALGYTRNRGPLRRLAELVTLELVRAFLRRGDGETRGRGEEEGGKGGWRDRGRESDVAAEGLLMGAAGLLPSQRGLPVSDSYVALLEEVWSKEGRGLIGGSTSASEWEFFRVRPINFPPRRVAGLAMLVSSWPEGGLACGLASLARTLKPRAVPGAMEALLLGGSRGGYWVDRCDFGLGLRRPAGLIGRQRAGEVVVNVFLPFLAGWASHLKDRDLADRVLEVYRLYPKRGDNEITRYMAVQISGIPRPKVARSACRQQGLLWLCRRFCEAKQCGECTVATW